MDSASQIAQCDLEFARFTNRFRFGEWLFHNLYDLYSPIYTRYKKHTDRFILGRIRSRISPGATILDIGSNIGVYSAIFSDIAGPGGRVHAFEPDPLNFERLRRRAQNRGNVSLYPLAVSDRSGPMLLYRSNVLNVDHRLYDDGSGREAAPVETVAIDDLFGESGIDFVKMDIQGFEHRALLGMRRTLARNPHITLCIECWPYGLKKAGTTAEAVLDLLADFGFQMKIVDSKDGRLTPISFSSRAWRGYERQPAVDFDIWCSRPVLHREHDHEKS